MGPRQGTLSYASSLAVQSNLWALSGGSPVQALAMQPIGRQDGAGVADQSATKFGKRSYTTCAAARKIPSVRVQRNAKQMQSVTEWLQGIGTSC